MTRFIFFTKTMYDETPRIRHQLAELLTSYGHEVVFYQKPLFFFENSKKLINKKINEKLEIRQTKQLIHHQLRVHRFFSFVNSFYEANEIKKTFPGFDENDVVVNFNYDYFFLRRVFYKNKIITVINDDFVAQAKFNKGKHVLEAISNMVKVSNSVLTVSYPLYEQSKVFSDNVELFFPWSKDKYKYPEKLEKNTILLWAHIDGRIDFDIIEYVLNKYKEYCLHLVGPVASFNELKLKDLVSKFDNLKLYSSTPLDELPLNDYFASIIPYKSGVADIEAVTASNKTFQLLSKALPLITHGMPSFYEHEAIFKCNSFDEVGKAIEYCHDNFYKMQPSIEKLVNAQQPADRYAQIMSIVNEEKSNV